MRKAVSLVLCALTALALTAPAGAVETPTAQRAILIHADTGTVLYEKNADERALIASTTKLMTALVTLERCDLDEQVEIRPESVGIEGSTMYLEAGQTYTVRELLQGLILASGNDAANALALHVAGSEARFAELMNEKARSLGLENTQFKNPHGLDAEGHYSTARDLAAIMRAAMENADFAAISATRSVEIGPLTFVNHNKLLWRYAGCLAGKTGYTQAAGRSLVSCAERNGLRLICVTLTDPDDWNTHAALYDWAFQNYSYVRVSPFRNELTLPLISGLTETVKVGCPVPAAALLPRGARYEIRIELPQFVYAPVSKGEVLGRLVVALDGAELGSAELRALEEAPRDEEIRLSPWERFRLSLYRINRLGVYYPAFGSLSQ